MRILGIMLVQNEDRFVAQALHNTIPACDEMIVVDHQSDDKTPELLRELQAIYGSRLRVVSTQDSSESHRLIQPAAGSDTWVLAVDGDEVYDPAGLLAFRERLLAGEFAGWWVVFGNVLNLKSLDLENQVASGHLAPPCRSMTKLYNFAAIDAWDGPCVERLHGGTVRFRAGYDASKRCALHESVEWDDAQFRCLHMCFLPRSSRDSLSTQPRRNIMDRHSRSLGKWLHRVWSAIRGQPTVDWKQQKYARGPLIERSVAAFFPKEGD